MPRPANATVVGFHFICRRDLNVVQLPDGLFDSGHWKVNKKHALRGTHLALHEHRNEPSYLQGEVVSVRLSPEDPSRVIFRVRASASPLGWPPNSGSGEKGYCWTGDTHVSE